LVIPTAWAQTNAVADANEKCMLCHENPNLQVERNGEKVSLAVDADKFKSSVHGMNTCTTCHAQQAKIPHDPVATKAEVTRHASESCSLCHTAVVERFKLSEHAKSGQVTCTSCHTAHEIKKSDDPQANTFRGNIEATCTSCHDGEIKESYQESFHGKAVSLGSTKAATCVSCHGAHDILGPDNPESMVAKANIPQTCAQCHNQPKENFAVGAEHFVLKPQGSGAPMYFTFKFFTWLTIITMTLLIIHIELELYRKYKLARRADNGSH